MLCVYMTTQQIPTSEYHNMSKLPKIILFFIYELYVSLQRHVVSNVTKFFPAGDRFHKKAGIGSEGTKNEPTETGNGMVGDQATSQVKLTKKGGASYSTKLDKYMLNIQPNLFM